MKRDGHIEPFGAQVAQAARHPRQPPNDAEASALASMLRPERLLGSSSAGVLFLLVYARFIFAGYHFFFVSHPAQEMIKSWIAHGRALRSGEAWAGASREAAELRTRPLHRDPRADG